MLVKFATSLAAFVMAGATVGGAALVVNGDAGARADTKVRVGTEADVSLDGTAGVVADLGSKVTGTASLVTDAVLDAGAGAKAGSSSSVKTSSDLSTDADAGADADADGSIEGSAGVSVDGSLIIKIKP